jgi:hypothetical protein
VKPFLSKQISCRQNEADAQLSYKILAISNRLLQFLRFLFEGISCLEGRFQLVSSIRFPLRAILLISRNVMCNHGCTYWRQCWVFITHVWQSSALKEILYDWRFTICMKGRLHFYRREHYMFWGLVAFYLIGGTASWKKVTGCLEGKLQLMNERYIVKWSHAVCQGDIVSCTWMPLTLHGRWKGCICSCIKAV